MAEHPPGNTARAWLGVVALAVAAFGIVTTEFAPVGLMSAIAGAFDRPAAEIGLSVTVYAWIGAAAGLLSPILLKALPRKQLLVALVFALAASNAVAAQSSGFAGFLAARMAGAVAHGCFWAVATAVAAEIVPRERLGLATAIVFGGITVAIVLGVPLTNLVGEMSGWRFAFAAIAVLGLVTGVTIAVLLPPVGPPAVAGWRSMAAVLGEGAMRTIYGVTALMAIGHFAAYTFIEPYLRAVPGTAEAMVSASLAAFGAAGVLGNMLTGALADRYMRPLIAGGFAVLVAALAGLGLAGPALGPLVTLALVAAWGGAVSVLFAGLQIWMLRTSGAAAMPAAAIHAAVVNLAIGLGASCGALLMQGRGPERVMLAAAGIALVPLAAVLIGRPRGLERVGTDEAKRAPA